MPEPPSRRWFQLNLSTVIVLTLTSAGLLYFSFVPTIVNQDTGCGWYEIYTGYGWPNLIWFSTSHSKSRSVYSPFHFHASALVFDAIILIAVVLVVGTCVEILARRLKPIQIHLITALTILIVLGVLLGINLHERSELFDSQEKTFCYGWPISLVYQGHWFKDDRFHFVEPKGDY